MCASDDIVHAVIQTTEYCTTNSNKHCTCLSVKLLWQNKLKVNPAHLMHDKTCSEVNPAHLMHDKTCSEVNPAHLMHDKTCS